jgi:hypothetical protein
MKMTEWLSPSVLVSVVSGAGGALLGATRIAWRTASRIDEHERLLGEVGRTLTKLDDRLEKQDSKIDRIYDHLVANKGR